MSEACRKDLLPLWPPARFDHPGLGLTRYLRNHATSNEKKENRRPEVALLQAAMDSEANEAYRDAFKRWKDLCSSRGWLEVPAATAGSLAIGLGNESPLEVGMTVHHTYGMPVIPGSAVKGLCSRVAKQLLDENKITEPEFKALFGDTKSAGCSVFHDAWYDPDSVLAKPFHRDVITVHHQKYYGSGGRDGTGNDVWPTDYDDPIPVAFLVVKPGARFLFAIECPDASWRDYIGNLLKHGLEHVGLGGKTNAGYGRFRDVNLPPPAAVEMAWEDVAVTRSNPLAFTFLLDSTQMEIAGRQADDINKTFSPEFRDRLKKRPTFNATITAEVRGAEITFTGIQPTEGG